MTKAIMRRCIVRSRLRNGKWRLRLHNCKKNRILLLKCKKEIHCAALIALLPVWRPNRQRMTEVLHKLLILLKMPIACAAILAYT